MVLKNLLGFAAVICVSLLVMTCRAEQPNVVLFFIDDLGFQDLGCYQSQFYETPCIDRLSKRSVRFTQFYSAHPVCSPTRAALMTGKAPQRLGITQWIPQPSEVHLPDEELTLGEAFQQAGYRTGYIGKWHLGADNEQLPDHHGFDWMKAVNRAGQPASYFHPFRRKRKSDSIAYWDVPDMEDTESGDYLTDKLTDHAIEFISEKSNQPFFLCLAHYAVHTPIESPKSLVEKYKAKKGRQYSRSPESAPVKERNGATSRSRQDNPAYAAMIENLDMNVGRVLDRLDELKLRENTVVVFTSDNGGLTTLRNRVGPTSVRPLRAGKGWCYEGGIRVPTLISWPGKLTPATSSTPAITMDLFPTLLDLAKVEMQPQQHVDGTSLAPILRQDNRSADQVNQRLLGWHYPHNHGSGHTPSTAFRDGPWKLIWLSDRDQYELYNLEDDEAESKDLAQDRPDKVRDLAVKLKSWLAETNSTQRSD